MWMEIYGKYPDKTYLTDEDKATLMTSPFFFRPNGEPVAKPAQAVEKYAAAAAGTALTAGATAAQTVQSPATVKIREPFHGAVLIRWVSEHGDKPVFFHEGFLGGWE